MSNTTVIIIIVIALIGAAIFLGHKALSYERAVDIPDDDDEYGDDYPYDDPDHDPENDPFMQPYERAVDIPVSPEFLQTRCACGNNDASHQCIYEVAVDIPESKVAVDIPPDFTFRAQFAVAYVEELTLAEYERMRHFAPRLFSPNWYQETLTEFSAWSVQLRRDYAIAS